MTEPGRPAGGGEVAKLEKSTNSLENRGYADKRHRFLQGSGRSFMQRVFVFASTRPTEDQTMPLAPSRPLAMIRPASSTQAT